MNTRDAARIMTAECLCFRSRRVARLITRLYDEALRPIGLEATQLTMLNAIAMAGNDGAKMRWLADQLGMEISTLSRNLKPLERDGAIAINRVPEDRRVRLATLTAKGEEKLAAALPLWRQATDQLGSTLGSQAADELRLGLDLAASSVRGALL
jgi:DNA-binding MarR family transcriptional regulator